MRNADDDRDATILRLIRWGWAYTEIAQALDISKKTVQRVANRSREKMAA